MREVILKIGAEGGSLTIFGTHGIDGLRKYYLVKNSVALHDLLPDETFDEELVTESSLVTSWTKAILLLADYPRWHQLFPIEVHPEFAAIIFQEVESRGGTTSVSRWRESLGMPPLS